MSCEEVRAQLPDYTLGTLSETEAAAVRRHLRACSGCRLEARTLDEGVTMFAGAAHAMDPPPDLKARHGVPTPFTFRSVGEWIDVFAEHDLELEHVESYRPKWPTLMTYHHSVFVLVSGSGIG